MPTFVICEGLAGSIGWDIADYIPELARRVRAEAMEAGKFGICNVRLGLAGPAGRCGRRLGRGLVRSGLVLGMWLGM